MKLFNKLFSAQKDNIDQFTFYVFGKKFTYINKKLNEKYCISKEEWIKFIEKINGSQYANEGDSLYFLRNKTILLNRLGNMLKRNFIDIENCSYDDFETFVSKYKKFIAKIKTGGGGYKMKIYDLEKNPITLSELYSTLEKNKTCLLEEYIQQCEILNKIYPDVVSTVRIITLNINGTVEIISYILLRISTTIAGIQNKDMISIKINPDTGLCMNYGVLNHNKNKKFVTDFVHPYSNYPLSGLKVPYFEEIKQLAINTAKLIPEIVFAGWDIAITDNGPVIVEGNGAPYSFLDENYLAMYEKGVSRRKYYNLLLEYCNFKKNLTLEMIQNIENIIFLPDTPVSPDFDFVIILGSSKCEYRALHFCNLYKNNSVLPKVIASGGNKYSGEYEYVKIQNVLKQNNIPDSNIILEKKSKNSKQNLIYSFKIINKFSAKNKNKKLKIGIITAGFHSVRINKLADKYRGKYDIRVISAYGKNTARDNWYKSYKGYTIIMNELKKVTDKPIGLVNSNNK